WIAGRPTGPSTSEATEPARRRTSDTAPSGTATRLVRGAIHDAVEKALATRGAVPSCAAAEMAPACSARRATALQPPFLSNPAAHQRAVRGAVHTMAAVAATERRNPR